jgi:hypothetical protein
LYVVGGKTQNIAKQLLERKIKGEMWSIDLNAPDSWRREPEYPDSSVHFFGLTMIVHRNKAWVVTGQKEVHFFDLETNKWGSIMTRFTRTADDKKAGLRPWPWSGAHRESCLQARNGKLYVFGGTDEQTSIGSNLFMELNLDTKVWRRLTGYPVPTADYTMPGPRRYAQGWIMKDDSKMYLAFGDANRYVQLSCVLDPCIS